MMINCIEDICKGMQWYGYFRLLLSHIYYLENLNCINALIISNALQRYEHNLKSFRRTSTMESLGYTQSQHAASKECIGRTRQLSLQYVVALEYAYGWSEYEIPSICSLAEDPPNLNIQHWNMSILPQKDNLFRWLYVSA